jgi:transposase
MHSMTQEHTLVVGGVDAHADTHHAAALDQRGALLGTKSFPTTTPGYRELLDWLSSFGEVDVVAVESTGSYAAALVRYLREHEIAVVEINQAHAHTRRRIGKSDPIDAEMAARLFQAGKAKAVPKQTNGIVESIRLLRVARDSAVKSRSAALVQIRDLLITAPQELRDQLSCRKAGRARRGGAGEDEASRGNSGKRLSSTFVIFG